MNKPSLVSEAFWCTTRAQLPRCAEPAAREGGRTLTPAGFQVDTYMQLVRAEPPSKKYASTPSVHQNML